MIKTMKLIACIYLALSLTGCIAAAVGAGVAGGVYAEKNYKVNFNVKKKKRPAE